MILEVLHELTLLQFNIKTYMKYKTYDRYCVKIVIECAECAGIGSRFHQPIDTYGANLCI